MTEDLQVAFVGHGRPYPAPQVLAVLAALGFSVTERPLGTEAVRLLQQVEPSLVLLALDGGQRDLTYLREIRSATPAPIVVLVRADDHRPVALQNGADVCLPDEAVSELLEPQVAALSRSSLGARKRLPAAMKVQDLVIDFEARQVTRAGEPLPLTPTEFLILACLAENVGKVVSPVEVLATLNARTVSESEAREIVKVYVRRIQSKLQTSLAGPHYVYDVRGTGYMLERRDRAKPARPR